MALSASTVWEVRTTGADTNGGGFVTGASGTDWSQQDAAQYSVTDGVTDGSTTITSATAAFGTDVVGNLMYVAGGTGSVAANWYQITVRNSATSVTVDRSTGLTAGTGVTLKIGGALLTIQRAMDNYLVADMLTYVKAGTYNLTVALDTPAPTPSAYRCRVIGYNATRGDNPIASDRPLIKTNSNAINALNVDAAVGWRFSYLIFDGSGSPKGVIGLNVSERFSAFTFCKVTGFSSEGFVNNYGGGAAISYSILFGCEVTACGGTTAAVDTANAGGGLNGTGILVSGCWIHDNTKSGILIGSQCSVTGCIISSNSGGSSDGVLINAYAVNISGNVLYGNGRDGIRSAAAFWQIGSLYLNNIVVNNAGYGFNASGAAAFANAVAVDFNAYYNNTSGARNNVTAGAHDITLTADPFTNAGAGDFSLNSTAGGGAALKGTGFPGTFPGSLSTGYADVGPLQHQDVNSLLVNPGMSGGMRG